MHHLWTTIFYEPLYNGLIFLVDTLPGHSIGLAVIVLTLIVKIILFPLAQKSIKSQIELKRLEPLLEQIKKEFPDKQEQAKKTFELYRTHRINPFSGCLVLAIQLPIIIALYQVFIRGLAGIKDAFANAPTGALAGAPGSLYSFVHFPADITATFLGINLLAGSIALAVLAALSQFAQAHLATKSLTPTKPKENEGSFKHDFAKSMQFQMKYILPVFVGVISYTLPGAIALYWVTSNLFTVGQEFVIRRKAKHEPTLPVPSV